MYNLQQTIGTATEADILHAKSDTPVVAYGATVDIRIGSWEISVEPIVIHMENPIIRGYIIRHLKGYNQTEAIHNNCPYYVCGINFPGYGYRIYSDLSTVYIPLDEFGQYPPRLLNDICRKVCKAESLDVIKLHLKQLFYCSPHTVIDTTCDVFITELEPDSCSIYHYINKLRQSSLSADISNCEDNYDKEK